jgi:hypothetical protein
VLRVRVRFQTDLFFIFYLFPLPMQTCSMTFVDTILSARDRSIDRCQQRPNTSD